jgi:hypothetical protein
VTEIAKPGRRKLVFDGDGSQFLPDTGLPCSVCGKHQLPEDVPSQVFIRVREKLANGTTRHLMLVCPDCVARMFLQVERLSLWNQVSGVVMAAIKRLFEKRWAKKHGSSAEPANRSRPALGSVPGPKLPTKGLDKLLPPKSKS